jgi:hypothetical protein
MHWTDINFHPTTKTLRQFAAVTVVFLVAVGTWQYVVQGRQVLALVLAGIALGVGGLGLVRPAWLRWLLVGATVATFPIGWLMSWLLFGGLYYLVFTPLALAFWLAGRDPLDCGYNKQLDGGGSEDASDANDSYWTVKPQVTEVRRYFRQF